MEADGREALAKLDRLLAEKPHKVGQDFSETTRCLAGFRDTLIAQYRRTGAAPDRERLCKTNAVLAVIVGGHFPLGGVPWEHLETARTQLAEIVNG